MNIITIDDDLDRKIRTLSREKNCRYEALCNHYLWLGLKVESEFAPKFEDQRAWQKRLAAEQAERSKLNEILLSL